MPKGDITLENGTWLMVQSKHGRLSCSTASQLDLSHDVTLYRDDGTTLRTASASIDLKSGAAASAEPTHAEGPFGMLDAQGFTVTDKGAAIQFAGPAQLVLNGVIAMTAASAAPARCSRWRRAWLLVAGRAAAGPAARPGAWRPDRHHGAATASSGGRTSRRSSPAATPGRCAANVTVTADG